LSVDVVTEGGGGGRDGGGRGEDEDRADRGSQPEKAKKARGGKGRTVAAMMNPIIPKARVAVKWMERSGPGWLM
jgi:hypothetical protein